MKIYDTKLMSEELFTKFTHLPYKCTRTDELPLENGDIPLGGMYWTHQFYNFVPKSSPDYYQDAGIEGSDDPLYLDVLEYLEAYIPDFPPRKNLYASYVNVLRYGNNPGIHVDAPSFVPDNKTVLVYLNAYWHPDFAGETVFFNHEMDACKLVAPRPGRVVIFDGRIPHTGRPPSSRFMYNRYVLAYKYMDPDARQEIFDATEVNKEPIPIQQNVIGFDSNTVKEIWKSPA